jgi:tetratricopeptide (TPR) repeat protein
MPGIRVEVDEASTAVPITSTYTEADGTFALYNIPKGTYEVVAESGDARVSDDVILQPDRPLELRFAGDTINYYSDGTVSVAHILVPERARKLYSKAYAAFTEGKNEEAELLVDQALQIEPHFADALSLRGLLDMQKPDLQEAQQYLEAAIHVDPAYSPAYIALGAVYNHEGRFDDALRASERGISLSPRSWQAYFEMAKASVSRGMYQKALQFARQAQRLGGNSFASLHLVKACALYPMKLYKDARYEIQAVISREPKGTSAKQAQALLAEIDAAEPPIALADAH